MRHLDNHSINHQSSDATQFFYCCFRDANGMTWRGMTGVDGRQDLLFAVRTGDEQELVLLGGLPPRHDRGAMTLFRSDLT